MLLRRKGVIVCVVLLLAGFAFRFCLAHFLPNDEPNDGKVYSQIARNLLEQHVYSHATEAPRTLADTSSRLSTFPGSHLFKIRPQQ